jgi:hypothetical protein
LAGRYGFTVVKIEDVEKPFRVKPLIPLRMWMGSGTSNLCQPFNEKAVELSKILSEMQVDANGTLPKKT